jgi:hypothetical protein
VSSLPSSGSSATPSGDYPTEPDEHTQPSPGRRRLGIALLVVALVSFLAGTASLVLRNAGSQPIAGQAVVAPPPALGPHPDWTTLINPTGELRYQIPPTGWRPENAAGGNIGQVQLRQGAYFTAYTCGSPAQLYQRGQLGSGSAPKTDPTLLATNLARAAATNYYTPPRGTTPPMITVAGPEPVQRTLADGSSVTGVQVEAIADQQADPCLASEGEVLVLVLALPDRDAVLVVNGDIQGGPASPPPATADQLQAILDTANPTTP